MTDSSTTPNGPIPAPIPRTFLEYVRSMGPGVVVVLTWLGAGDIVDASVAGGSYGYALMWVLAIALIIRWLFVSTIAKYQLCNERGESVMQGLGRLHPLLPIFVLVSAVILSHFIGIYMYLGLGDSCAALSGIDPPWAWAVGWAVAFWLLLSKPIFKRIEQVFLAFLALLSISLIGAALRTGPDWGQVAAGTIGFEVPEQRGSFDPAVVAFSLVGAVAGSLANLMYPYFIREKGWTTPAHRKVQFYDLAFGILVIIVLDLAVWIVGAEALHPEGRTVEKFADLAEMLALVIGPVGRTLIYLGVFAAVGSSIVGNALAYSYMGTDAYLTWGRRASVTDRTLPETAYRTHPLHRWLMLWALFSPLPWVFAGQMQFVPLTVIVNAFQVLLLPVLAVAMWVLTANPRFIGQEHRNRPWENLAMGVFLVVAVLGALGTVKSLITQFVK